MKPSQQGEAQQFGVSQGSGLTPLALERGWTSPPLPLARPPAEARGSEAQHRRGPESVHRSESQALVQAGWQADREHTLTLVLKDPGGPLRSGASAGEACMSFKMGRKGTRQACAPPAL